MNWRCSLPIAKFSTALIVPWPCTCTILKFDLKLPIKQMSHFSSKMNHIRRLTPFWHSEESIETVHQCFYLWYHCTFWFLLRIGFSIRSSQSRRTRIHRFWGWYLLKIVFWKNLPRLILRFVRVWYLCY